MSGPELRFAMWLSNALLVTLVLLAKLKLFGGCHYLNGIFSEQ